MEKPALYRSLRTASLESEDSGVDFDCPLRDRAVKSTSLINTLSLVTTLLAVLFVATNSAWVVLYLRCLSTSSGSVPIVQSTDESTQYPPFQYMRQPFHQISDFNAQHTVDKNATDDKWRALFPNGNGLASLPNSLARENGLPVTAADPLNEENGVYLLAGFHHLHCLTVLRSSLWHFKLGEAQNAQWHHITHCLDTLRQSLMCDIDTTLLWTTDLQIFGDGQAHTCKDYWGLNAWLAENRAYD